MIKGGFRTVAVNFGIPKGCTAKEMVIWKQKGCGRWKRFAPKIYTEQKGKDTVRLRR